jgi:hypothetical protein
MSSPVVTITISTPLYNRSVLLRFNQRRICLLLRPKVTLDCVSLIFSNICLLSLLSAMNSPDRKKPKKASLKGNVNVNVINLCKGGVRRCGQPK